MSQIAMSQAQRIEALKRYGYSEREAEFLCLAALHGGYFLRRQYRQFLGRALGANASTLIERAVAHNHVKATPYAHNTIVYHLCARPFYATLGQADNRNRRERQVLTIKNKLMSFDFVLAHPKVQFLVTEDEKVSCFERTLNIDPEKLPAKLYHASAGVGMTTRYFVEKYPIFVPEGAQENAPISFCFVDEGLKTASRFETFLMQYDRLFAALPQFHVVYVTASAAPFRWAERAFERFFGKMNSRSNGAFAGPSINRLLAHFADRERFEAKQLSTFDRAKLIRFRDERTEFSDPKHDALFEAWKSGGDKAVVAVLASQNDRSRAPVGTFSIYLLKENYDLFGNLTSL